MRIKISRLLGLAMVAAVGLAALTGAPEQAQAHKRGFSLYLGHGGFGLSVGPRYGYGYYPYYGHYYRPYTYRRHYYYAPRKRYYRKRRYGRCSRWANRCARNWGWHNRNWRGCMQYHGCR